MGYYMQKILPDSLLLCKKDGCFFVRILNGFRKSSYHKAIILVLIGQLFLSGISYALPEAINNENLSPPLSLKLKDFGDSYIVASICRDIEKHVSFDDDPA